MKSEVKMTTITEPTVKLKHTPGPWRFKKYCLDETTRDEMRKRGIEGDMLALSNDGQAAVMSDSGRIAAVDCRTEFKRGKGHLTECPEREANARLISLAPDMLEFILKYLDSESTTSDLDAEAKRIIESLTAHE